MREIKFRAWDKEDKYMLDWEMIKLDVEYSINQLLEMDRFEMMQFTGLCDKNGKEIYEGDIVTDDSVSGPCDGIMGYLSKNSFPVEFVKGCFVVKCNSECASDHIFENYHLLYEMGVVEVIGNIYEHPDLLGGQECES